MKLPELASVLATFERENSVLADQEQQLTTAEGVVESCAARVAEFRNLLARAEADLHQAEQERQVLAEGVATGRVRRRTQETQIYSVMADMVAHFQEQAPPVLTTSEPAPLPPTTEPDLSVREAAPISAPAAPEMEYGGDHQEGSGVVTAAAPMPEPAAPVPVAPQATRTEGKKPGVLLSFLNRLGKGSPEAEAKAAPAMQAPPAPARTAPVAPAPALKKVVGGGPVFTIE